MTISHVHCRVKDLVGAVEWFGSRCKVAPSFSDARMAVREFGACTLILDSKEPSDDVSVEVLVRCKPQHRRDVSIGAGLAVVPVCPKEGTVAQLPLERLRPVPAASGGRRRRQLYASDST